MKREWLYTWHSLLEKLPFVNTEHKEPTQDEWEEMFPEWEQKEDDEI